MEDLRASAQRLGETRGADRHHHELLNVDVRIGVRAAVEDVHHRHRQQPLVRSGASAGGGSLQRLLRLCCRSVRGSHRHAEDRVRAQPALGRGAVEIDHRLVERALVELAAGMALAISPFTFATALSTPLPR